MNDSGSTHYAFTITYDDKGVRMPIQRERTWDDRENARAYMQALYANNGEDKIRQVYGPEPLAVSACEIYDNGYIVRLFELPCKHLGVTDPEDGTYHCDICPPDLPEVPL